ncbi:bifunctional diaminohydroxyphosphoribosylaminopyrimidine deaminase/5-amino-6-(5-phosphoribosylamino)uracil reductase RibD [Arthrobacter roseus]|nr:bifunctional diaminohydroxyphosphoribosylaminopyrimidine deaminase/5-amino-6-(5-phosphoribosylamino)uracil reductase RibD [Arthrobacter roseus]
MDRALQAAARGPRGANPLVGAVLTGADGKVISVGWHRGAGTPHAEIDALSLASAANISVDGTTMHVSLEPCNHTGRTGPCSEAIRAAGIRKVIYATPDPQDHASGGARYLAANGIVVERGLRESDARALNNRWFAARAEQRPFVTLKVAQTLDGFTAAADGSSQWITGSPARQDGHRLRRLTDAVLVGTGTAHTDNPRLTARDENGAVSIRQPLRVVAGLRDADAGLQLSGGDGQWLHIRDRDPKRILDVLHERGIGHVLIEGGPTVAGAFIAAELVDELFAYVAPSILGAGKSSFAGLKIDSIREIRRWEWDTTMDGPATRFGADLRLHLRPEERGDF